MSNRSDRDSKYDFLMSMVSDYDNKENVDEVNTELKEIRAEQAEQRRRIQNMNKPKDEK